jgi:hypothetical protein
MSINCLTPVLQINRKTYHDLDGIVTLEPPAHIAKTTINWMVPASITDADTKFNWISGHVKLTTDPQLAILINSDLSLQPINIIITDIIENTLSIKLLPS